MKKLVLISSFIFVALGIIMFYACTKEKIEGSQSSASYTRHQRLGTDIVYDDSMAFVSRIHSKGNPVCAKGDSVREIKYTAIVTAVWIISIQPASPMKKINL